MTRKIQILSIIAALVFPSVAANAVEDTTDPVLTDFTLTSASSIDTGPSSVTFDPPPVVVPLSTLVAGSMLASEVSRGDFFQDRVV